MVTFINKNTSNRFFNLSIKNRNKTFKGNCLFTNIKIIASF